MSDNEDNKIDTQEPGQQQPGNQGGKNNKKKNKKNKNKGGKQEDDTADTTAVTDVSH
jgi:hypothetical protein